MKNLCLYGEGNHATRVASAAASFHNILRGMAPEAETVSAGFSPGLYDVTVVNPDGQSAVLAAAYTVEGDWSSGGPWGGGIGYVVADPIDSQTVYAAAQHGTAAGFFKSTDGGEHWFPANSGLPRNADFHDLEITPCDPPALFGAIQGVVYRSTDGAVSWTPVNTGMPASIDVWDLAVAASHGVCPAVDRLEVYAAGMGCTAAWTEGLTGSPGGRVFRHRCSPSLWLNRPGTHCMWERAQASYTRAATEASPGRPQALAADHFAILKVGPGLTFALREAIFALAMIEETWLAGRVSELSHIRAVLEVEMLALPDYWRKYYAGDAHQQLLARQYSFSDRIRYYWPLPAVQAAPTRLEVNLSRSPIPLTLLSQFLPTQFRKVRVGQLSPLPRPLILDKITEVLADYNINHPSFRATLARRCNRPSMSDYPPQPKPSNTTHVA